MAKPLRLAVVTDLHFGEDDYDRLGSQIQPHINAYLHSANMADAGIVMGDLISAKSRKQDCMHMKALCESFRKAAMPFYYVIGNNDVKFLSRNSFSRITGSSSESYSVDIHDWHIVVLNPDVATYDLEGPSLTKRNTLEWLRADLENTKNDTIVISHLPLSNQEHDKVFAHYQMTNGNTLRVWYHYPQAIEARKIMSQSGKVRLCLAGHGHRDEHRVIDDIHYITQQSMAQAGPDLRPIGRFLILEIKDKKISLDWHGNFPPPYRNLAL